MSIFIRSTLRLIVIFFRDAIKDGLIAPSYVPTTAELADIFTKALGKSQFDPLMSTLGICAPHAPT